MKKIFLFLCATVLATVSALGQSPKIVTVSMSELFEGYYKTVKFRDTAQNNQTMAENEFRNRQGKLKEFADAARAVQGEIESGLLAESAKEAKQQEFQAAVQQYQQAQQELEQWRQETLRNLQAQNNQRRLDFLKEIRDVVISVAKDEGAQVVLDTSDITNSGVPTVLFADPTLDITAKVDRLLNKDQAPAVPASTGPTPAR